MFYVGDILWMEKDEKEYEIPDFNNFSGCIRWTGGTKIWYDKGKWQSFQDLETQEWMPARIWRDGTKWWYDKGERQSFQDPKTKEWMPAIVWPDGTKWWYDKGELVDNPETYPWERES